MRKQLMSFLAFSLVLLMANGAIAQGAGGSNNITVDNEDIAVEVTGGQNVPKFSFWQPGENNTVYRVQFHQMFEVVDTNNNSQYDDDEESRVAQSTQALAAWSWDFSEIEENDDGTTFNITGDGSPAPVMGNFDLTFVNHLGANASSFKFDVIVDNYEFTSSDENAMLVLAFTLTSADGDDEAEDEGDTVQFGDAYLDIEETASTDGGDIDVGLTTPSNGSAMAYIAYQNFDGGFVHDPTIGFGDGSEVPFNGVYFALALFVALPILMKLRKD